MSAKKWIAVFVTLVIVIVLFLLVFTKFEKNKKTPMVVPQETPTIEEQIEEKFNGLTIPDDAEKVELKNVSDEAGMGIATRTEILADLPEPGVNESYQVVLKSGNKMVVLGKMERTKGGYLLEYDSSKYPGYDEIIVIKGSKRILEGSF